MDRERLSTDQIEQRMLVRTAEISRLTSDQILDLEELDHRQIATADGCRSLSEWASARFDMGLENARNLVRTMRRTVDRPHLRDALASGEVTFDRVEALSKIPEDVGLLQHLDIAGVRREAAKRSQISAEDEYRTAADRFLVLQPSLDESWWRLFGGLDGASGAIVDKVLTEIADQLPALPDGSHGDSSWQRATALVQLAVTDDPPPAQVTVFVDTQHAVESNGQAGLVLEAGPRVGQEALQAILCDAVTEVTAQDNQGRLLEYAAGREPFQRPYAGESSTATETVAPPTAVTVATVSKSIRSSPGAEADPPPLKI